jgi:hypothetical protein
MTNSASRSFRRAGSGRGRYGSNCPNETNRRLCHPTGRLNDNPYRTAAPVRFTIMQAERASSVALPSPEKLSAGEGPTMRMSRHVCLDFWASKVSSKDHESLSRRVAVGAIATLTPVQVESVANAVRSSDSKSNRSPDGSDRQASG